ncbi:selenocysteine-specific elongation factor [Thermosporothrix hazakensis]|jgi:selenocysteine-specific elongation factor|uniref:Selenocysteine-specific elongation factor n=2 Tax=Thermosporothrix TaxID=768650 RepID=A0A326UCW7_THEHA|nr:selenocysteine-specific translation elongation factor [Thermosporothrix hazakensis]PZW26672.1 selenocysteine-specific elongation factor [Thermosporothrix hazakensis]BBH89444.1 selenocysteine-specific translation factor [Thermosporothrix sp. COM3]GCE47627.1 selenocysteine-specific translation factor [Thermosporothrix hazakensis]
MSCIGTAGHIDHGKSTLVQALTGIDPDRLAEEKARGMTIDLGFAWLTLPGGREVSIVDVPGHESFIKNMLAGTGGIDAALLVVAADEGIMPQTREHLAILDLLRVPRGVVALTKADLVDEEWLELVREEVSAQLRPTTLAQAPILPVSSYTREGLPELLSTLDRILSEEEVRQDIARPRLFVDRVFTLTGFGTVVTGTLLDGTLRVGQEVEILPAGLRTRIRGMQTHKQAVEVARPGSRVALNLANIARSDVRRGDVVALPGQLRPVQLFDARIRLLPDAPRPLTHNTEVEVFSGSQEIPAKVRLLDVETLQPGASAWAQFRLSRPAVLVRRDPFVLRIPSPSMTIGGGEVVDTRPRYHRRFQASVLETLEQMLHGTPEDLVLAALETRRVGAKKGASASGGKGYELRDLARQCNLAEDVTQQICDTLLSERRVRKIGNFWVAQTVWEALVEESVRLVSDFHRRYPLRSGLSKEEWRTRLHLTPRLAADVFATLQREGVLEQGEIPGTGGLSETRGAGTVHLPGYAPQYTEQQKKQVVQLLERFRASPFTPPTRAEAEKIAEAEVVTALIEQGVLVKIGDGLLFLRETYEEMLRKVLTYLYQHGTMTVAEARDLLGTTRKYILPVLEHMDILRITRRNGDERVPGPNAALLVPDQSEFLERKEEK